MKTQRDMLLQTVLILLSAIAPETATETLPTELPLRQLVDLDSMDWLNLLVSLNEHFGVTIPESDYAKLVTLNDLLDYLQKRIP